MKRASDLLYLSNEIWSQIIEYIPVTTLSELRFLCRRFQTIVTFSKRLEHYRKISHEICDTEKLYHVFIDCYNLLLRNLTYYFNFPSRCYLRYRLQFLKNLFIPSGILCHMFYCPRSEFAVSNCYRCAMLHVISHPNFLLHIKTLYRFKSVEGTFSDDVVSIFKEHSITSFNLRIAYKNDEHYEAVMSKRERCLEFFAYGHVTDFIMMYCEVLLRFLFNFFWTVSKDTFRGLYRPQRNCFLDTVITFMKDFFPKAFVFLRLLYSERFELTFSSYLSNIDYPLYHVRVVNSHYIKYCKQKFNFDSDYDSEKE